jgi:hypothetical protein
MYMCMNTSNTTSDWHNLNNTVADLRAAFDAKYPSGRPRTPTLSRAASRPSLILAAYASARSKAKKGQ